MWTSVGRMKHMARSIKQPPHALSSASSLSSVRSFHGGLAPYDAAQQRQNLRTEGVGTVPLTTPVFQVYGANTDVGKTIVSAGICRAAVHQSKARVAYIKPLQTGVPDENEGSFAGDAAFVVKHVKDSNDLLEYSTLFSWKTPVSPHLAATLEGQTITDDLLLDRLAHKLQEIGSSYSESSLTLVETAGGVCSPSASMRFQADVYRSLRLPVVLVGDGKLGGISATISALESLLLRGYDIAAVCLIEQDGLENAEAIMPKTKELGVPLFTMDAVPPMPEPLDQWYKQHDAVFADVVTQLQSFHQQRLARLDELHAKADQVLWWPFTQHKKYGGLSLIDSAHGDEFCMHNKQSNALEPMFDACASWWTQGVGHGNSKMATSIAYTAARYGHIMFPENVHEPAFQLSEKLLASVGKNWASRVYFSDDGSTAVEVALKMAFRKFLTDHKLSYAQNAKRLIALAQANCYHGDTLGVMNIAEPSVFNEKQHPWYRPEAVFGQTPSLAYRDGALTIDIDPAITSSPPSISFASFVDACDPGRDQTPLAGIYRSYVRQIIDTVPSDTMIGALLLEPILIGAGGMVLVDPLFQRVLVQEAKERNIPVIYDEVFSGCWRLGVESGRELLGLDPDIACYAKLLTGGVVPLAVTLASEPVFDTFYADEKGDALLHGHSFTAHPIGCAAAITALDMYAIQMQENQTPQTYWNPDTVRSLSSLPSVARAFELGTVMCIELASEKAGYASNDAQQLIQALRQQQIYARALGNVVYMMCSPLTSRDATDQWLRTLETHLRKY